MGLQWTKNLPCSQASIYTKIYLKKANNSFKHMKELCYYFQQEDKCDATTYFTFKIDV